ncbi:MAG: DUF262 domain-containing protein [Chloroflexi bacterium]|nr:DUF262 domain-containing protein [Chloroflexota bacterium]
MSQDDLTLGEMDVDESFEFPPPERKIVVQPYDLSLQTLYEQWDADSLILPEIQREYVWDNGRASRLIESFILNIPVPPIYFSERQDAVLEVIDGHQRVESIVRFFNNEFGLTGLRVLSEYSRRRYHQLPDREQRFLKSRSIRTIVITHESHPNMKFEVFERLNTGGIALNAQELRNSLYRGTLNDLLKKLVHDESFRTCIGTKNPRRRFVDEELVLRWFALNDRLPEYRPPLKRFLNEYMNHHRDAPSDWLEPREHRFRETMQLVRRLLSDKAFRLIDRKGNPLSDAEGKPFPRGVNRALFDAQSIAFSWVKDPDQDFSSVPLIRSIAALYENKDFQEAVSRATGNKSRVFLRISMMANALSDGGLSLSIPYSLE